MILSTWGRVGLVALALFTLSAGTFAHYYRAYARMVDGNPRSGSFATTSTLYAAPQQIMVGDEAKPEEIASYLRRCGYSESTRNGLGWYRTNRDSIEINPGRDAYNQEGALIKIQGAHIAQIVSLRDQSSRPQFALEPETITNFVDQNREKSLMVHFNNIPKVMVNAILAAEDKHFFTHGGFDPPRIVRAAWVDLKDNRKSQGASTLTQQLARTLWLGPERGWRRKIPETFITLHLEHTRSKQQIFEDYANAVYLGNQGSFSIHGFGKASKVYLGKDLDRVTLPDAALLAGLIQAPRTRDPFRYPERAKARRNMVLRAMRSDGFITEQDYQSAISAPVVVTHEDTESSDAPYFVDLVDETLQNQFADYDFQNNSYRVYTTLDKNLQRDAVTAVRIGIQETDQQWKRRSKKYGTSEMPQAQVAMVVLDAQTGEVKALVGGRNYGTTQLNRAMSKRQPGSSFKPFVYAAALSSASAGGQTMTPASTVEDEPTTFEFNGETYQPANHEKSYSGTVTLRYALAHSLNIPAVKVAESIGYGKVARVARAAGLNVDIKPTPSIALGSYEVTPLEIAGAYTVFANSGSFVKPALIKSIRDHGSTPVFESQVVRKPALDPKVAYLVENMMEDVLRSGTGYSVRARGFLLPAAGKTGTSRDGWFAGFTSRLICVVWVGFDDNRDFELTGAVSALPIWTEFMKRAHQHREYKNVHAFAPPSGIVTEEIDAQTGELATAACPKVRNEVFIAGTEPRQSCRLHDVGIQVAAGGP